MKKKLISAGFIIVGTGLLMLLPSIILIMVGSPIKGEGDAFKIILNSFKEAANNNIADNIIGQTNSSIDMLENISFLLILVGIIFIVIGFFMNENKYNSISYCLF